MKNLFFTTLFAALLAWTSGCAGRPASETRQETEKVSQAAVGPSIVSVKIDPSTIELTRDLAPNQRARVIADVKDFTAPVKDVRLRFLHVPLEIPMQNIGGTTWSAPLSSEQLQNLAVSGRTIRYQTIVVATNENGQTVTSDKPVQVAIKTPELVQPTG